MDDNVNPFAAPMAASDNKATNEKRLDEKSFAHQAVRFSLYAPVLLMATNMIVFSSLGVKHGGAKVFVILSLVTILAAFFLGIVGLVGSLKRRAIWSAFLGLFGTLLNGAIVGALLHRWR